VEHAVLLGNNLVFVDSHLPELTISEIRSRVKKIDGKIIEEERKGELGRGGKHLINFKIEEEEIKLIYYAEDATRIGRDVRLKELKKGYSIYFVKVPLPKEASVDSLASPDSLANALRNLAVGGFYLERECPLSYYLKPEIFGFNKVASGYISALSINSERGNLYRKMRNVAKIELLLKIDREIYRAKSKSFKKQIPKNL
jgi:hypothetical protein